MFLFFVTTGFLTRSFRQERRSRGQQHYQIAQTLADYGYYDGAIQQYRDALTFVPDNPDSRLGLAQALYALGRFNEAETHLLDLRRADPTWSVVNRLLARTAARRGDLNAAISFYQTAIYGRWSQHPVENRIKARLELADLLRDNGEMRQLVGQLLELLDEVPRNADLRQRIAWMFLEAGSYTNARDLFAELALGDPSNGETLAGQGQAEFALDNYAAAREAFLAARRTGYQSDEAARLLELSTEILDLDPTVRGLGQRTRLRRSQELLERTADAIEHCRNPQGEHFVGPLPPPPPPVDALLRKVEDLLAGSRRQNANEETTEANIALAQALWKSGEEICAGADPPDPALVHVLSALSR